MKLKPRYVRVPLDEIGYAGGWAEVRTNPTPNEITAWAEAQFKVIEERGDDGKGEISAETDALLIAVSASFLRVCYLGEGEEYDLSGMAMLKEIQEPDGDPGLATYLLTSFFTLREARLPGAVDAFRGRHHLELRYKPGDGRVETAADAGKPGANGQEPEPVPGHELQAG